jgi:hypothetical protein
MPNTDGYYYQIRKKDTGRAGVIVIFLPRIRKAHGSNSDQATGHSDWGFSCFLTPFRPMQEEYLD